MVLKQHRQGCLLNMSFFFFFLEDSSKIFPENFSDQSLLLHEREVTCLHDYLPSHYSQISDWPSIFFPVSWRKRKKSQRETEYSQTGWVKASNWQLGYKLHCFPQKPLTLVDFLVPILKIGQCPWSRISSGKPCFQQWKQIISLLFSHYRVVIQ